MSAADPQIAVSWNALWRDWIDTLKHIFARLIVTKTAGEFTVLRERTTIRAGRDPVQTLEFGAQTPSMLASLARGAPTDIVAAFPQSEVLTASLKMPHTSRAKLRQALRYEIGGVSPLGPEQVYYDFTISPDDREQCMAELRIVSRDLVDSTITLCHAAGLHVGEIQLAGLAANWRQFPIDRLAYLRLQWHRHRLAILLLLNLVLLLLVLAAAYVRVEERTDTIITEAQSAEISARRVERIAVRIQTTLSAQRFFTTQRKAPSLLRVVADLSEILPAGTWLDQLELQGRRVHLQGRSRSTTALLAILERSGRFANAQFTAPVTRQSEGIERFELSADALPHE